MRRALGEMKLKSEISRPTVYETLAPNQGYTVFGAAWAGETEETEVSVRGPLCVVSEGSSLCLFST